MSAALPICRSKLWNLRADCSNAGLYWVTISFEHIFSCSVQVRVARLALLEPKTRNLALLRSSWLQHFYLATFWLFCNLFRSTNVSWRRVSSGAWSLSPPPQNETWATIQFVQCLMSTQIYLKRDRERCSSGTRNLFHAVPIESVPVVHCTALNFNFRTRREVHRAQAHAVSTTQIDNNRHRVFCNGVGVGPQDYRHFL